MTCWVPKLGVPNHSMLWPDKLQTGSGHGPANCGPSHGALRPECPAVTQVKIHPCGQGGWAQILTVPAAGPVGGVTVSARLYGAVVC